MNRKGTLWAIAVLVLMMLCGTAGAEQAVASTVDWEESVVTLCGTAYTLPVPVSTLTGDGWVLEDMEETLEPNQYMFSQRMEKDGMKVYVQVINLSIDELPVSECMIGQMSLSSYDAKDGATLELVGDVTLGTPKDTVLELYGTPGRTYEGESYGSLTYEGDSYVKAEFDYDVATGLIDEISMRNFTAPQGYNDAAYAAECEVPESVRAYEAPEELGEDLLTFRVKLDGAIYQLPAPVQAFVDNGWKLGSIGETKIAARDAYFFGVELRKGGLNMSTALYNDDAKAMIPEYCLISEVEASADSGLTLELPKGITLGMDKAALEQALEGEAYEASESSMFTYYELRVKSQQEVEILVGIESGKVEKISVQMVP